MQMIMSFLLACGTYICLLEASNIGEIKNGNSVSIVKQCALNANQQATFRHDGTLILSFPTIRQADIGVSEERWERLTKIEFAVYTVDYIQPLFRDCSLYDVKYLYGSLNAIFRLRRPNIWYRDDIISVFNKVTYRLKDFCSERSNEVVLDHSTQSKIPIASEDMYTLRAWILDELTQLTAPYAHEVDLLRTIQALQLINEERNPTRLAELINGDWKTDDRILGILNGK